MHTGGTGQAGGYTYHSEDDSQFNSMFRNFRFGGAGQQNSFGKQAVRFDSVCF